jgi:hypothetical protein
VLGQPVGQLARPVNSASSRSRSWTAPTISAVITGGSARTTGICETPYSRRMSIASRTVSVGWVCTNDGSGPSWPLRASTSPTVVVPLSACRKP